MDVPHLPEKIAGRVRLLKSELRENTNSGLHRSRAMVGPGAMARLFTIALF
jgi:hypothetical protein